MDYKKVSTGLYVSGVIAIVAAAAVAIAMGWRRDDFFWILIPGCLLEVAGTWVGSLARKRDRQRVARELEANHQQDEERL